MCMADIILFIFSIKISSKFLWLSGQIDNVPDFCHDFSGYVSSTSTNYTGSTSIIVSSILINFTFALKLLFLWGMFSTRKINFIDLHYFLVFR